jgi:transposase-like protein
MTIAQQQDQVHYIWHQSFQTELDTQLRRTLRQGALLGVQTTLEAALVEELNQQLGFAAYERLPGGEKPPQQHRSGYFQRGLDTQYGRIDALRVPKLRRGNKDRPWTLLVRYQRAEQHLLDVALYLYVLGLSVRDLQEGLYLFMDQLLSRQAVNRITESVEAKVEAWRTAPIEETPAVLIVDGVWVQILYGTGQTWLDKSGHRRQQMRGQARVILVALALWDDGRSHVLHYEVAAEESPTTWAAFFGHLLARGLDAETVKLVVSDGSKGLLSALGQQVPKARQQRCTVHKVRGIERYLCYGDLPETDLETGHQLEPAQARQQRRAALLGQAHQIFEAETRAEAEARLAAFNAHWQALEPKAVHNFNWGIKRCLVFYDFAVSLHRLIHSTNLIERFFRAFRTKADEIGSFPNEGSCLTLFYLVMVREHAKHHRLDFAKT